MAEKTNIERILAPLCAGTVPPGSKTGQSLIRDALLIDPERTADLVRPIDRSALREGMRGLGLPEKQVADLLRQADPGVGPVADPFAGSDAGGMTPFEDPGAQMRRGPVPPWAR
ncbi:hypothetical protein IQ03_01184 [Gemmobacter caeni]|jgi:hypothetical protein|uniref:Uncharacterized protein n=1 Tax=Gemmobacter caeni TaxID=589035 RepID=A0A2T6B933_9RHOB|nr:hypothetical protein [Gemmobacter caeni]PTX52563.1 hypothetical protein C8N34_102343 [Gemmobacter caeni]TWJ02766.1 hypothetical protein IQ03_01184 [Gemmobacter caeni]